MASFRLPYVKSVGRSVVLSVGVTVTRLKFFVIPASFGWVWVWVCVTLELGWGGGPLEELGELSR